MSERGYTVLDEPLLAGGFPVIVPARVRHLQLHPLDEARVMA